MGRKYGRNGDVLRGVRFVYIILTEMMLQPSMLYSAALCIVNRRPILIGGWPGIGSSWFNNCWTTPSCGFRRTV